MNKWSKQWLVSFSAPKTKSLIVSNKKDYNLNPTVSLGNQPIEEVTSFKYLGLSFTSNLRWNVHIDNIVKTALRRLDMMSPLKWRLDRKSLETMYFSFVLSAMEYANVVWSGTYDSDIVKLENVHVKGMRLITGATARSNISNLHKETGFPNLKSRFENNSVITLYKIKNCNMPEYLKVLHPQENKDIIQYNLRNREDIRVPTARLKTFKRSFFWNAIALWNILPNFMRNSLTLADFKDNIKKRNGNEPNVLYYYGKRWPAVHHSRLRLGCSKLNFDLCNNLHVTNSQSCRCGATVEHAEHFFMLCPLYDNLHVPLRETFHFQGALFTVETLLYGSSTLDYECNTTIFDAVHKYMIDSNRFL